MAVVFHKMVIVVTLIFRYNSSMDVAVFAPTDISMDWTLDFDVSNGHLVEIPEPESNNTRQRASLAAFFQVGTIPGAWDVGADWAGLMSKQSSLVEVDNAVKKNIETYANPVLAGVTPMPMYNIQNGSIQLSLSEMPEVAND